MDVVCWILVIIEWSVLICSILMFVWELFYAMFAMLCRKWKYCLNWASLFRYESVALEQSWHQHQDPANGLTFWPAHANKLVRNKFFSFELTFFGAKAAGSPWASGGPEKSPTTAASENIEDHKTFKNLQEQISEKLDQGWLLYLGIVKRLSLWACSVCDKMI